MAAAIGFVAGGAVLTLFGVALLSNYRGVGNNAAAFGGALTFMVGGGDALRRPRRAASVSGVLLLVIGVAWITFGVALATR